MKLYKYRCMEMHGYKLGVEKIHVTSISLVCPVDLYHSLKDSPSCSEWIDVCYKWLFENMQWV